MKVLGDIGAIAFEYESKVPIGVVTAIDEDGIATVQIAGYVDINGLTENIQGVFVDMPVFIPDKVSFHACGTKFTSGPAEFIACEPVDKEKYPHTCDYCGSPCWKGGDNSLDCTGCSGQ